MGKLVKTIQCGTVAQRRIEGGLTLTENSMSKTHFEVKNGTFKISILNLGRGFFEMGVFEGDIKEGVLPEDVVQKIIEVIPKGSVDTTTVNATLRAIEALVKKL